MLRWIKSPLLRFFLYCSLIAVCLFLKAQGGGLTRWIFGPLAMILVLLADNISTWLFGPAEESGGQNDLAA